MTNDQEVDLVLMPAGDVMALAGDQITPAPCQVMEQDMTEVAQDPSPGVLINVKSVLVRASAFPELKRQDVVRIKRRDEDSFTEYRILEPPQRIQDGYVFQLYLGTV